MQNSFVWQNKDNKWKMDEILIFWHFKGRKGCGDTAIWGAERTAQQSSKSGFLCTLLSAACGDEMLRCSNFWELLNFQVNNEHKQNKHQNCTNIDDFSLCHRCTMVIDVSLCDVDDVDSYPKKKRFFCTQNKQKVTKKKKFDDRMDLIKSAKMFHQNQIWECFHEKLFSLSQCRCSY